MKKSKLQSKKKNHKLVLFLFVFLFFIISPNFAFAAGCKTEIPSVNLEVKIGVDSVAGLSEYVAQAYKFIIGAVGIFAAVKIIIAGLMWSSAAGNSEMLSQAKAHLIAALTGLLIALLSYILLNTLNTWFINLKTIEPPCVQVEGAACNEKTKDESGTETTTQNNNKCPTGQDCKTTGKCSDGSEGDSCKDHKDCTSGACDLSTGECEKPGSKEGEDCGAIPCQDGLYCIKGLTESICKDGSKGDSCNNGSQCKSGKCGVLNLCV